MSIFENSLEKIGRIISRQYGIQVVCEGNMACTDGKTIYLPAMKEVTPEIKQELHGFLDHETAHIKFTTFGEIKKCLNGFHKNLLNNVEDERIERLMAAEYPGAKENLDVINNKYSQLQRDSRAKAPASHRIILSIRDVMSGDIFPFEEDIKGLMEKLTPLCLELNDCKDTKELREVTEKITKLIDDTKKEEEERKKEENEKKESDEESKGDSKGKDEESDSDKDNGESEEESSSDGGEEESEEEESDSESDDENKSSEESEESQGNAEGDVDGINAEAGQAGGDTTEGSEATVEMSTTEMSEELESDPVKDFEGMFNEEIAEHIKDSTSSRRVDYIAATTQFDTVEDFTNKGDIKEYGKIKKDVQKLVSGIRRELERILKVQENAKWRHEQDRGDLSRKSLSRLASDKNYRKVFKKFEKKETNNVAVQILVDQSGSMYGRMDVAKKTVVAISESLNGLDIPFEVLGFSSRSCTKIQRYVQDLERKDKGSTNRFFRKREALEMCIFKSFDSSRLTGIECLDVRIENPDGEAVRFAAKRLSKRKEKRKVLIVLSDGMPACADAYMAPDGMTILNEDLRNTVKNLPKFGIEVVGFGIETDAPKAFYPNHVIINKLEELPKKTMKELSKILTRSA